MHEMITVDLGHSFIGWHGKVGGRILCVVTPRVATDARARAVVRDLVTRQGGDCASCLGCVVGQTLDQ